MCSIGEDEFDDDGGKHAMLEEKSTASSHGIGICDKCSAEGDIIKLSFRKPECKNCFLHYVHHKFRATLGSSKILPKGANVLLICDGSPESIVLLEMMYFARSQNTFKRLHCMTKLLYVDESNITSNDKNEVKNLVKFLNKYEDINKFIVSIGTQESLTEISIIDQYFNKEFNFKSSFNEILSNIKSLTSRQDYVKIHKFKIIQSVAEKLQCDFVFMSDISTSLATELLTSISLGRGASAALDVSLVDTRMKNIKIIRPIKDLNKTEVQFYLEVNNLPSFQILNYGSSSAATSSIQNLTKHFVDNLQQNFSSTVSTIVRIGDKIAPKTYLCEGIDSLSIDSHKSANVVETKDAKCSFCNSNLDCLESKAILATEFSRVVTSAGSKYDKFQGLNEVQKNLLKELDNDKKFFCHSCCNIQNDVINKILFL